MKKKMIFYPLMIALVFGLASCKKDDGPKNKVVKLRPVKVAKVGSSNKNFVKSFSGITKASVTSRLSFRVSGTLTDVLVDVGDKLKKGDLLAKLDPTDYQIKVQEVSASLARAKAEWRNAKATHARVQALYERGNASLNELDATRAAASSGEAAVKSVEKQLELVKRRLEYTRLYSPTDCSVAYLDAEENENVGAGQPLMLLNCGKEIEVKISVPSSFIDKVKKGDKARIKIDSMEKTMLEGVVKDVGVSPTGMMTTYPVIIAMSGNIKEIRPGMSAEVSIITRNGENALFAPPVSVGEDNKGNFVFKVMDNGDGTGVIRKTYITAGKLLDKGILVKNGLSRDDLVVSAGVSQVKDGLKVRIVY